jgi:hypothetical protein
MVAAAVAVPCSASAGEIFGTIRDGKRPLVGAKVEIRCGDSSYTGRTDKYGGYSISVPKRGRCTLHVSGKSRVVQSFRQPAKFDFNIK